MHPCHLADLSESIQQLLAHVNHTAHKLCSAQRGCHTKRSHQLPAKQTVARCTLVRRMRTTQHVGNLYKAEHVSQ